MPIALDPTRTFTLSLKIDADKPDGERPVFTFRYLTVRQWIALSDLIDRLDDKKSKASEMAKDLAGHIGGALVGWTGIDAPFTPDAVLDVLNPAELYELAFGLLGNTTAGPLEKKESASPSPSSTASCAPVAA